MTSKAKIAAHAQGRGLNALDLGLQGLTVLMLVAAIVAVQTRVPCYLFLVAAPFLTIAFWACAGLVIDRQALRRTG